MNISKRKKALIEALPHEIKQALIDRQRATLEQDVYEISSQTLISVWGVNLVRADDYIFANEVRYAQKKHIQVS